MGGSEKIKNMKKNELNRQVGGSHYKNLGIQPIEYILSNNIGYLLGNVIKYVTRDKGDTNKKIEDLEKAQHYISIQIAHLKTKNES